jgi:hypothetical protein
MNWQIDRLQRDLDREKVSQNFVWKAKVNIQDSSARTHIRAAPHDFAETKNFPAAVMDRKNALARVRNASCVAPKKKGAIVAPQKPF